MATNTDGFVHLRVHSEFSIADGLMKVGALADAARRMNMPAVALTDRSNLFGLVKFYQASVNAGVKPLLGADLAYQTDEGGPFRIAVLAMNSRGYRNLLALVSAAYVDADERGVLTAGQIFARQEGLLVLSGARQGEVGQALAKGDPAGARRVAAQWGERFPERLRRRGSIH
jgi:DNA polymerase-3 subunit alpha